jgi:DnaK suppressor protein
LEKVTGRSLVGPPFAGDHHREEVIAMPARLDSARSATHLSPDQIERLRRLLIEEYTDRRARAVELQDPVDLEPDLADVLLDRTIEAIDEIEAALRRIDEGTYGVCVACGLPIPFERLEVLPAADRCVACQAGRDRALR